MVEDGGNGALANIQSADEWLLHAQELVPVAVEKARQIKGFPGRWKMIISKLEQIPSHLSDLSSHPCFSKNALCREQLQAVSKTLKEAIELAELCVKEKYEGKLRMQSDLDALSGKLDLNLHDCGLLIKTGVLGEATLPLSVAGSSTDAEATTHGNTRELLARLQIGHLEAKHKALDSLVEAMKEDEKNVLAVMGRSNIAALVQLLTATSPRIREKTVTVICSLAESGSCENWLVSEGVLPPLIRLVESGSTVGKEKATISLQRLSMSAEMARAIVGHGGVRPLIEICQTGDSVSQAAAACTLVTKTMADSRVETISRLAQWRIDNFGPCSYKKSDPFKIGIWNWHLSVEKNRYLYVRLFPEPSRLSKEQPPFARFIIRVSNGGANRRLYISQVNERLLRTCEDFVWYVDCTIHGRFIVDVEFLELKIYPLNGGDASSVWPSDGMMQSVSAQSTLRCLARMLDEGILADTVIHTADGTLKAHKAVLSASSPVFQSMFHHDLKEKESSTIYIEDMSVESCMALLSYLYGTIKQEDFWKHRLALLGAANKYDIADLKDACEESLLEDINSGNVLERLQEAWLYQLSKLKKGCLTYLFDFGKIYDVRDEINNFFRQADRELMLEMFQEVLTVWKPV